MEKEQLLADLKSALHKEDTNLVNQLGRAAVESYENEAFGYYFLGESALLAGNYESAELLLAKAIELEENNDDFRLRFAAVKEAKGEYEDACIVYTIVLENNPANIYGLLGLARFYLEQDNDAEEALTYIEQAEQIAPTNPMILLLKIRALLGAEEYEKALAQADIAIEKTGAEAAYLLKINILSNMEGDQTAAITATYSALVDAYPDAIAHRLNYANFLLSNKEWAKAEAAFAQLLALSAGYDATIAELVGVAQNEQGKYAEAIATFDGLVANDSSDWAAYVKRANAKLSAGDPKGALADLQNASQYVPETSRLDLLRQEADLFFRSNQLKEAYARYKKLSEDKDTAAGGYFGIAKVYQKSNTAPEKAFEALQKAVALGHSDAQAFMLTHYAEQLEAQKTKLTSEYTQFFAQNAASKALQPLFGKIWRYSPALNPMDDIPAELSKRFHAALIETTIIITNQGIAIANPMDKKAQLGVYKIEKESPAISQLQLIPLNGARAYSIQMGQKGAYLLYKQAGGNADAVLLKEINPAASPADIQMLKKYFSAADLAFLGDQADAIISLF
jgi:tetratricopeptide (TPR) repeat protein